MDEPAPTRTLFFDDPRIRMTVAGRFLVRVVSWIAYLVLIAATFTFLISGITRLQFVGVFLVLVLLDIIVHRGEGDRPIEELSQSVNVARAMRPATFAALERGFDASIIAQRDFFLEMAKRLLDFPEIEEALARLDVSLKEFKQKFDEFEPNEQAVGAAVAGATREGYARQAEALAVRGFGEADTNSHHFIEVGDLFAALADMHDAAIDRLFSVFSIQKLDIELAFNLSEFATTLKKRRISIDFDPSAMAEIARLSHDPALGARPLRRIMEEKIPTKKIEKGTRVKLVFKDGAFEFVSE